MVCEVPSQDLVLMHLGMRCKALGCKASWFDAETEVWAEMQKMSSPMTPGGTNCDNEQVAFDPDFTYQQGEARSRRA